MKFTNTYLLPRGAPAALQNTVARSEHECVGSIRLQSSWIHLITSSRNFVEVR
jgi:hypothetical protein